MLTVAPLHCYFVSRIVLSILHAVLVSTEALWGGGLRVSDLPIYKLWFKEVFYLIQIT